MSFARELVWVVALVPIALSTASVADARPQCQETRTREICETSGSVLIKARPGTTAPPANQPAAPWITGGLGRPGPNPFAD